ncbi:hypothetical protein ACFLZ0_02320 [Patescibacteria group bacterium]
MTKKTNASMQGHLPIKDIRNGVIVLKNKGMRAVLLASSVNLALKSTEEQDAVIYKYQLFLNSLDFPVQIMVSSRKFDISPYIKTLRKLETKQENELLKIQTTEYIDFVQSLTEMTNIMTTSFYVIIPYAPISLSVKNTGIFNKFFRSKFKERDDEIKEEEFQKYKTQLWQRVEFVMSGLRGAGVNSVPLNTEELIELFYKFYNPSTK